MFKKFNVNGYIKVKLTGVGIKEMERQHNQIYQGYLNPPQFCDTLAIDEDGYIKFQMWELLAKFGHMIPDYPSCGTPPFDTDILIYIMEGA